MIGAMTVWTDLIAEIRREPDADAPRRVAADWLLERGDPRGEYVALACELAARPDDDPRADELRARLVACQDLARWRAPIEALGGRGDRDQPPSFTRGFIEAVTLVGRSADNFAAICALEPIVDLVLVSSGASTFERVAARPELAQLRSLRITGKHTAGHAHVLASPYLGGLRRLDAPWDALQEIQALPEDAATRALGLLARVAATNLDGGRLYLSGATDTYFERIAAHPLEGLTALTLRESAVSARGLATLGARLDRLERLSFELTPFTVDMAEVLIAHLASGRLRYLQHSGEPDAGGLDRFVASPAFRSVEHLDVEYGPVPYALATTPHRGALRKLSFGWGKPTSLDFALPGVELDVFDEGW